MTQDNKKFADPGVWDEEEFWGTSDLTITSSEFSPNMAGTDIMCGPGGATVSPSEILMNPAMLTSPYPFDSPSEGYDTSPLYGADDIDSNSGWYSLFPDANPDSSADDVVPANTTTNTSTAPLVTDPLHDESLDSSDSPETSPKFSGSSRSGSSTQKRSSTSGVRKRQLPLPPIVVEDPSDVVAMKRARNTLAARKSRAKKAEKMDEMEARIEGLKAEVEHWKRIALAKTEM